MSKPISRARVHSVVLIAEDFQDARELTAELLRLKGYEVVEADTGPGAVSLTRQLVPDAIVMDLGLPSLDGLEATRQLRSDPATRAIPIILLTARTQDPELQMLAHQAGCTAVLPKPCEIEALVAALNSVGCRSSPLTKSPTGE